MAAAVGSETVRSGGCNAGDQAAARSASGQWPTEQRRQGFAAEAASQERDETDFGDEAAFGEM